jgi:hypothetical protein
MMTQRPGRKQTAIQAAILAGAILSGIGGIAAAQFRDASVVGFDGGQDFRSDCGQRLLVGFNYRHGDALDGIEPVCAAFGANGQRTGPIVGNGRYLGGRGGDANSILCPSDMAIQGLMINVNPPFVMDVSLKCVNPGTGATATQYWNANWGFSGSNERGFRNYSGPELDCRANEIAWGIQGASSSMINRLGLVCRSDVPGLRPASGPLRAGNAGNAGNAGAAATQPPGPTRISLEDRRWCLGYAERAVAANASVAGGRCGLTGPRHSASQSDHMSWCLVTPRGAVLGEERARDEQVRACLEPARPAIRPVGNAARTTRCNAYADAAVAANQQAIDYQCGFGADGGRHLAPRAAHFSYCMNAPEDAVAAEGARRQADLEACGTCRSYSRTTVSQIERASSCSVPADDPLWMPADEQPHFDACLIKRPGTAPFVNPGILAFQEQRETALNACGQ